MKTQTTLPSPYFITSGNTLYLLLLSLIFITACSLFKEKTFFQSDSLHRHNIRKESTQQSAIKTESLRFYSNSDSLDRQTFAEIFPKGPFKYSLADGFSGEAERLVINERVNESSQLQVSGQRKKTSELKSAMKESERAIAQTRLKEKEVETSNLNLRILVGCALIFLLIFLFRKGMN